MTSPETHAAAPTGHDGLPFHPDCAICQRLRITGALDEPKKPRAARATALVAAGTIALSAAGPVSPIALAHAQGSEGSEAGSDDSQDGLDFDPGAEEGGPEDFVLPTGPTGQGGSDSDDSEGSSVQDEPVLPATQDDPEPVQQEAAPPSTTNTQTTSPSPPANNAPSPTTPTKPAPTHAPTPPGSASNTSAKRTLGKQADQDRDEKLRAEKQVKRSTRAAKVRARPDESARTRPQVGSSTATTQPTAPGTPTTTPSSTRSHAPGTTTDGRQYVVKAGDSLWSIAADMAGADASPVKIDGLVDELWGLNAERVGTGDPSDLPAGIKLILPRR